MNNLSTADQILAFIKSEFETADSPEVVGDTPLFDFGVLDSFDLAIIVDFLESHFSITVDGEDFGLKSMGSANELATFVDWKREQKNGK